MVKLNYEITITAPIDAVWKTMSEHGLYEKWACAFSPDSTFEGVFEQGNEIKFIDPNRGGTKARLDKVVKHKEVRATHIATITKEGVEETTGPMTKKWIGSKEGYIFIEDDGKTTVKVEIETNSDFAEMFENMWPKALIKLKEVCEE